MAAEIVNIVVAGVGGQGVVSASDIVADVAFRAGHDVKKAEVHGMSQRGGSVAADIRYGQRVLSPMIPQGAADILVVLQEDQVDANRHRLKPDGQLLTTENLDPEKLKTLPPKTLNIALLGALSRALDLPETLWHDALDAAFRPEFHEANRAAFAVGRQTS